MDITHIAVSDIHLRLPLGMATITDRYVNLFVNSLMINGLNRLPTLADDQYNKFFPANRFFKIVLILRFSQVEKGSPAEERMWKN